MNPKKRPAKKSVAKRKSGRPAKKDRPITPEILEQIGQRFFTGHSAREIAEKIGVDESTIRHHLEKTLKPMWRDRIKDTVGEVLAEIEAIKRIAWQHFRSEKPCETRESIEEALIDPKNNGTKRKRGRPKKPTINIIKRVVSTVTKTGNLGWLQVIQWCITERSKILGFYNRDNSAQDTAPLIPTILVEIKNREEAQHVLTYRQFVDAAKRSEKRWQRRVFANNSISLPRRNSEKTRSKTVDLYG